MTKHIKICSKNKENLNGTQRAFSLKTGTLMRGTIVFALAIISACLKVIDWVCDSQNNTLDFWRNLYPESSIIIGANFINFKTSVTDPFK